ncbi:unnamed protein product [Colias eurytheme]|nr:unnamed protein product [Colias eurytheme]
MTIQTVMLAGDQLRFLSSTDKKCEWKNKQDRIVKEYNSTPIHQHACFSKAKRKCQSQENSKNDPAVNNSSNQGDDKDEDLGVNEGEGEEVVSTSIIKCKRPGWSTVKSLKHSKDQKKQIVEKVRARLKNSAFVKHLVGRHEPIVINHTTNVDVTYLEKQHMIFTLQRSELMENIKNIKVSYPHECCADTIKDLYCNYEEVIYHLQHSTQVVTVPAPDLDHSLPQVTLPLPEALTETVTACIALSYFTASFSSKVPNIVLESVPIPANQAPRLNLLLINRKWRRSLLDVRVKRGADIDSDHMLLMAELRLKLAAHKTISEKTTALYNISKLEQPETSEAYTQELKNKYNSLDVNDLDVNGNWEAIKSVFQVVGESVLGFRRRDTKPWMSKSTWELIEQRRKTKETLIQLSKNSPTYEEQNLRYSLLRKSLKRSVRRDRRNNTNLIADQAQKAAAAKNMAGIYKATKTLLNQSGHRSNTKPLKNENGDLLTTSEQQLKRWFTHFRDLLETGNPESSDIIPLHSHHPKLSNFNVEHPNCIEIKQAIDSLKCRKAPGKDRITAEMLRVDSTFTAKMLFPLLKQIWETETAPDDWKEGVISQLSRHGVEVSVGAEG